MALGPSSGASALRVPPPILNVRVQQRCRSAFAPPQLIHIDKAVPRLIDVDHESLAPSFWACACRLADVFRRPQRAVSLENPDTLPGPKGTIVGGAHLNSQSACWRCCAGKLHPLWVKCSSAANAHRSGPPGGSPLHVVE